MAQEKRCKERAMLAEALTVGPDVIGWGRCDEVGSPAANEWRRKTTLIGQAK